MGKKEKNKFNVLKYIAADSVVFPFILVGVAYFLKKNGFKCLISDYEKGSARIIQYILFFIGVAIFFFCDGISDFLAKKIFIKGDDKKVEEENISSYFAYTIIMLWILNIITITGFIGFLICGNISWLVVFLLLNISMVYKYFPSRARFEDILKKIVDV